MKSENEGKIAYLTWFLLLGKRLLKQPAFLALLLAIPLLAYGGKRIEQEENGTALVAVCIEDGTWQERLTDLLMIENEEGKKSEEDEKEQNTTEILQVAFYETPQQVEHTVLRGKADCGFVIPEQIEEAVLTGNWNGVVDCYETQASSFGAIAREKIAGALFQLYAEEKYTNYIEETVGRDAVDFAWNAYEMHRLDGSTFSFYYERTGKVENENEKAGAGERETEIMGTTGTTGTGNGTGTVFPLRGILATLIFLSALCGMLEYEKDKKEKRFVRLVPGYVNFVADVWIPTVFTSCMVLFCMGIREIGRLLVFQFILILYCSIIRMVLRGREMVAVAIPILITGSLVCSPVFIRLASYVPLFAILEKLFPTTYYLLL